MAKIVAKSANNVLGLVMENCKMICGASYIVFFLPVSPIMEYGAAVWDYKR